MHDNLPIHLAMKRLLATLFCGCGIALFLASCNRTDLTLEMTRAVAAASQANYEEALLHANSCVAFAPENVDALLLKSFCQFMVETKPERRRQPLMTLSKCTYLAPERFETWHFYGWALLENGQSRDAIDPLRKAAELVPATHVQRQEIQLLLARCYLANNLLDDALRILMPLQARAPYYTWPELYNELGILELKRGLSANAIAFFQTGLKYSPDNEVLLQNLAITYDLYLNDPAKASHYYQLCLAVKFSRKDTEGTGRIHARIRQLALRR